MKLTVLSAIALSMGLSGVAGLAHSAETALYATGPAQDASYVRFLNATDDAVVVTNGAAKLNLATTLAGRVSHFFPVKAGAKLGASIQVHGQTYSVSAVAKPSEFMTIVIVPQAAGHWSSEIVREVPSDFNALRASLSLVNLDQKCASAELLGGAKHQSIVSGVGVFAIGRRSINPVNLSVQLTCAGQVQGGDVAVGQLQAGERYSVFLLPLKSPRTLVVMDELAK